MAINRLPPLNALKAFEAAGRTGSFQGAARELYVTPSAISHQVKSLEEFLGTDLFERKVRRIDLTPSGKDYLIAISHAIKSIEMATDKLVSANTVEELKLSVVPAFLDRWLMPRLADFTQRHPEIELDISNSGTNQELNNSDIDMAVYFGNGDWPDIECQHLRSSVLVPVCSPSFLAQHPIKEPRDLLKYRLLQVKDRPDEWHSWFKLSQLEFNPVHRLMNMSSGMLTAQAARNGMGIALSDPNLISEEIKRGILLVPIELSLELPKSFYLVYRKNGELTRAMTVFRAWLTQQMTIAP
ncbi:transcriptional regulator GcvA [Reinekea forsetii]|nr:transcriptional regulator GcvA [Reinekea forsetii]